MEKVSRMGFCGLDSSYTVQQGVDCSKTCQVRAWKSGHKQEGRQKRVFDKMREASNARTHAEVVKIAEEGQTVAGELRRAKPDVAAEIHGMLGANSPGNFYGQQGELEKAITEHEQSRAMCPFIAGKDAEVVKMDTGCDAGGRPVGMRDEFLREAWP